MLDYISVCTHGSRVLRYLYWVCHPIRGAPFGEDIGLPIYEYECGLCNFKFERRQRFDEEPVGVCPRCTGKARRLIHSVPIVFKGSGFYCTDHGSGSGASSAPKGKEAESNNAETKKEEVKAKENT